MIHTASPQQIISRATAQIYNSAETVTFEDSQVPPYNAQAVGFDNKTIVGGVLTLWMYTDPTQPDSWGTEEVSK